jgi:Family of unknown function (DUF6263)
MLRQSVLGVVVLLVGVIAPAQAQEVKLQWKFKEGDKFYVEDVATTKTNVTVLSMQVKEESKTTTVTSYTVKKVTADTVVLAQTIENVDIDAQGQLGGLAGKIVEKMKGATFTVHMTPAGKVTKLEGYKEFAKKLAGDDGDTGKIVAALFTEDLFKASAEQAFSMTPPSAVKKGDTWKQESKIPVLGLGDFKTVSEYTYNGKGESGEMIGVKQQLTYAAPKAGKFLDILEIKKGNLKADNAKGKYVFDAEKGRLVSAKMDMSIRGTLTVDFNGMNLDLNMVVDQSTVSRVLDQNPLKE